MLDSTNSLTRRLLRVEPLSTFRAARSATFPWLLLKELFGHVDSDGDGALDEEDQKRGTDDQSSSELRSLGVHLLLLNDRQG